MRVEVLSGRTPRTVLNPEVLTHAGARGCGSRIR